MEKTTSKPKLLMPSGPWALLDAPRAVAASCGATQRRAVAGIRLVRNLHPLNFEEGLQEKHCVATGEGSWGDYTGRYYSTFFLPNLSKPVFLLKKK